MRYLIYILGIVLLATLPVHAETNTITMPKTGWPSDYELIRAEELFAQGRLEDSLDVLEEVLERNIESINAHALSGYIHFKLNNMERAEKHLFSVIDLDPRHMGAHLYLAEMDLRNNKLRKVDERLQLLKMICKGTDCAEYQYLKRQLLTANKDK